MLTKGDVLFALGKIKDARGSAGKMAPTVIGLPASKQAGEVRLHFPPSFPFTMADPILIVSI
jgi:hypothetical protein